MIAVPFVSEILAGAFLLLLAVVILLNILGLPGNWILLALVALWKYLYPGMDSMGLFFFAVLIGLGVLGEALEFGSQVIKAKQYGSSKAGTFAGIVGAVIGAIMMAPLFFGLGALLGALLGAFAGGYIVERINSRPHEQALRSAFGAMSGRFLGTVCKCAVGLAMLIYSSGYIWPDAPAMPAPPAVKPEQAPGQAVELLKILA